VEELAKLIKIKVQLKNNFVNIMVDERFLPRKQKGAKKPNKEEVKQGVTKD